MTLLHDARATAERKVRPAHRKNGAEAVPYGNGTGLKRDGFQKRSLHCVPAPFMAGRGIGKSPAMQCPNVIWFDLAVPKLPVPFLTEGGDGFLHILAGQRG